jgi:DNA polymerase
MLKMGQYHEIGVQDGIEYDYYPTCFLVKPVGGTIRRQEEEIEQIRLFNLKEIPENLAFEHAIMIKDYKSTKVLLKIHKEIRECERCRLHGTRTNAVPGEGPINARILICGQAPGRTEDKEGRPFIGRAGKFLNELLDLIELERERLLITSLVKCFPPNNRPPRSDELKTCKPYLDEQIRTIKPEVVIALGNYAVQALLGKKVKVSKVHGKPQEKEKTIIFPTFHPAAAMRFPEIRSQMKKDFKRLEELLAYLNLT